MGRVVYFLPPLNTISELVEYIESREKIHPILDPQVPDPSVAFGPYDLEPIHDRCINCEASKKIAATVTLDQRSGPMCNDCFILYRK